MLAAEEQGRFDEAFAATFRANGPRDPEGYRLLLTHTGVRSGRQRTTPLAYYDLDGRTVVVAGNGGAARHPAWYHNVIANPAVDVEKESPRWTGVATEIVGDDYATTWERISAISPIVDEFQAAVARRIPLVALVPS